jgi:hypothetical protein
LVEMRLASTGLGREELPNGFGAVSMSQTVAVQMLRAMIKVAKD